MNMNGLPLAREVYLLDDPPDGMIAVVTDWMRAIGTKELTFSVHENKVTIKASTYYRTTF